MSRAVISLLSCKHLQRILHVILAFKNDMLDFFWQFAMIIGGCDSSPLSFVLTKVSLGHGSCSLYIEVCPLSECCFSEVA